LLSIAVAKPDFLLIVADDSTYHDIGCLGVSLITMK